MAHCDAGSGSHPPHLKGPALPTSAWQTMLPMPPMAAVGKLHRSDDQPGERQVRAGRYAERIAARAKSAWRALVIFALEAGLCRCGESYTWRGAPPVVPGPMLTLARLKMLHDAMTSVSGKQHGSDGLIHQRQVSAAACAPLTAFPDCKK